jgi:hypothetical protein
MKSRNNPGVATYVGLCAVLFLGSACADLDPGNQCAKKRKDRDLCGSIFLFKELECSQLPSTEEIGVCFDQAFLASFACASLVPGKCESNSE